MTDWKQRANEDKDKSYDRMAKDLQGSKSKALKNKVTEDPPHPKDKVTFPPPRPPKRKHMILQPWL